jgi:uncharacterized protein with PIN domain
MLGGLARWLRAAGYDASWKADVEDWELIRLALREQRTLLTSDTGILRIGIVRDGEVPALFIPHGLGKQEQLSFVLGALKLPLREPRCMACGGPLALVSKEETRGRVPPRTFAWVHQFYECEKCRQLFWQGTHWQHIARQLQNASAAPGKRDS